MRNLLRLVPLCLASTLPLPAAAPEGFRALFNGRDLSGWEGDTAFWSVEDGAIVGRTTAERPTPANTFLLLADESPADFELRLRFRLTGRNEAGRANSGVQYRSRVADAATYRVIGYQADIATEGKYLGMLYEEGGRRIVMASGESIRLTPPAPGSDARATIEKRGVLTPIEGVVAAYRPGDWNELVILAEGDRLRHFLNGVPTAEVIDDDPERGARSGRLALQLHTGPPMTVEFRDVHLRTIESPPPLPEASAAADLEVAPGFKVDLLYAVPKEEQGSWVALTIDARGRLIASDQFGGLYRITLAPPGAAGVAGVERLAVTLPGGREVTDRRGSIPADAIGAHGLLYAFDSLYVMVNEVAAHRGLWRLRDTDGDDRFDEVRLLRRMNGGGEHGTHSLVLAPDGRSIWFVNGNFTALPENLDRTLPVRWGEDHLLPRMWDARGHAKEIYAPGSHVGRLDPEGRTIELVTIGKRNAFDIAFDGNGELFTYDSDMEWDIGAPWYMPTRINHLVSAGDYGWRSGAGRWPAHYADSLPAVLDIGPGSPTGTTFGTGARFPARHQRALFAADWTFGTLYAIHLEPDGATFRASPEEFVTGKPLPLTDVIVNPRDGALYFAVGGRRTQSALYRVTYVGTGDTAPAAPLPPTPAAKLRRELEALHAPGTPPSAIAAAWPHLSNPDRFVRFAARAALERQLPANWAERALAERDPQAAIEALIALARVGEPRFQTRLLDALGRIDFAAQPIDRQLGLLRAWQLAFTRMGPGEPAARARLAAALEPRFPHADPRAGVMLAELLVFLESPTIVAKVIPLLRVAEPEAGAGEDLGGERLVARNDRYAAAFRRVAAHRPDRRQIAYAYLLRNATVGWTAELRREFFSWFPRSASWRGGMSFPGFLDNIRTETLARIADPAERARLAELSAKPPHAFVAGAVAPEGPGADYTVESAMGHFDQRLTNRDFARGRAMFAATACIACHRFGDEGSGVGPDITGAGNRYSVRDLLENIIEPSKVISDLYGGEQFGLPNGDVLIGRVLREEDGMLMVMTNPFDADDLRRIDPTTLRSREPHPISTMPPGLVNGLNPEELKDLVAYLLSGGNPADPMFKRAE